MTACVVDASVVVAVLLGQGGEEERQGVFQAAHAPALLDVEVTQTLRGLVRGGTLDLGRAEASRDDLRDLRLRRHPDVAMLRRAWELRDVLTTYDALYVALAEALEVPLLTRDGRLARGVAGNPGIGCDVRVSRPT